MLYVLTSYRRPYDDQRDISLCWTVADEAEVIAVIENYLVGDGGIFGVLYRDESQNDPDDAESRRRYATDTRPPRPDRDRATVEEAVAAYGPRTRLFRNEIEALDYAAPPWKDDIARREACAIITAIPASPSRRKAAPEIHDRRAAIRAEIDRTGGWPEPRRPRYELDDTIPLLPGDLYQADPSGGEKALEAYNRAARVILALFQIHTAD